MKQQEISIKDLAVLLIDMQDSFLGSKSHLIPIHIIMLQFCNKCDIPVVNVEFECGRYPSRTTEKLMHELEKIPTGKFFNVRKKSMNAFGGTNLSKILEDLAVSTVLLMGVNAGECVFMTAQTAVKKYKVITSKDLIAGYWTDKLSLCKDDSWYKANTLYLENHQQVIKIINGGF